MLGMGERERNPVPNRLSLCVCSSLAFAGQCILKILLSLLAPIKAYSEAIIELEHDQSATIMKRDTHVAYSSLNGTIRLEFAELVWKRRSGGTRYRERQSDSW